MTESKVIDTPEAIYACDTTGSVTPLNLVAIGDEYNQRLGRQISLKSVAYRALISFQDAINTLPNLCQIMLVWDNYPKGSLPAITDILSYSTSTSFMNLANRSRFFILADDTISLGQAVGSAPNVYDNYIYKELAGVATYGGTTATMADLLGGAIYLVTLGYQGAGQGHNAAISARVRFTDA